MCRITYSAKRKQIQIKKEVDFGNFISKYDVIYDALKLIWDKNLGRPRIFGDIGPFSDIGPFGDMGNRKILADNCAWGFSSILVNLACRGLASSGQFEIRNFKNREFFSGHFKTQDFFF